MLTEFEGKIVKSLETIAKCLEKQVQIAEEAMKKSLELYEADMAMIKESQIKDKTTEFPQGIELLKSKKITIEDPY